jgi:hypothetical protein
MLTCRKMLHQHFSQCCFSICKQKYIFFHMCTLHRIRQKVGFGLIIVAHTCLPALAFPLWKIRLPLSRWWRKGGVGGRWGWSVRHIFHYYQFKYLPFPRTRHLIERRIYQPATNQIGKKEHREWKQGNRLMTTTVQTTRESFFFSLG